MAKSYQQALRHLFLHRLFLPTYPQDSLEATKECPYCGEIILAVAKKCKHCHEFLPEEPVVKTIQCPICGEDIPDNVEICPICKEAIK